MSDSERIPGKPDFGLLCYSIASQAMVCLGVTPPGKEAEAKVDLPAAKYSIDTLEMLREKTEGNRTAEETQILLSLLYDLRMRYVEQSRR